MTNGTASRDLSTILANAQLPALPQSAIRLLQLSKDPDNGPNEFAVPIEADPGLAGQVLKFVNSSYFGFSREISSVRLAINLVGVRTIKNFSLWSAVFSLMPNPKCGPFDLKSLWQDSLRRGLFGRTFGAGVGLPNAEDLFTAGLLQDMAIPVLAKELESEYVNIFETLEKTDSRLSELEEERFGWNHAQAAGQLARIWSLPDEFARLIEGHAESKDGKSNGGPAVDQLVVALSSFLPSAHAECWDEFSEFCARFCTFPGGDRIELKSMFEQIDADFEEFAPVLKLSVPSKTLSLFLRESVLAAKANS